MNRLPIKFEEEEEFDIPVSTIYIDDILSILESKLLDLDYIQKQRIAKLYDDTRIKN